MGKKFETTIDGKKITLRDLQSTMSNSKALIISKLLYYLINQKFIVRSHDSELLFVRKSLQEWADDTEIWFENGNKRKLSKSTVRAAFRELVEEGIVTYTNDSSRIRAYTICESNLVKKLSEKTLLKFYKYQECSDDYINESCCENDTKIRKNDTKIRENDTKIRENDTKIRENDTKIRENDAKIRENDTKVHSKTVGQQGLETLSGSGTYTSTYTGTNTYTHKSDKSDKSDGRTDNFSKKDKKDSQPISIGDIVKKLQPKSVSTYQKNTIVQDMFEIWQEELPLLKEKLNREKSSWLKEAFGAVFNSDLEEFRWYLKRAKTSKFITERPYLLNMKWLLNFETIETIKNCGYETCNPCDPSDNLLDFQLEIFSSIDFLDEPWICKDLRQTILSKLDVHLYLDWFDQLKFTETENGEIECYDDNFILDEPASEYANFVLQQTLSEHSEQKTKCA